MDENQAEQDLKSEEYKDFEENAELKAIIAGQKARKYTIDVSGVPIAIRTAIPKGLRDKIIVIGKQYEAGETAKADEDIYFLMAQICLDPPYTKPGAWKYIDEETGEVPNILMQMIKKITAVEGAASRFRNK